MFSRGGRGWHDKGGLSKWKYGGTDLKDDEKDLFSGLEAGG
jgi:hypothetical protein